MADSNITKRALAAALRELMEQLPFDKIQVGQICELCDMNRKSFYYHFKDKYDLLNWIFDVEFLAFAQKHARAEKMEQRIESIRDICHYFYENRDFYRKALKIQGQNSFSAHFREYIMPLIKNRFSELFGDREDDFELNFFTDAVVCAMERWLLNKECMPPDEFVDRLFQLICQGADIVHQQLNEDTE